MTKPVRRGPGRPPADAAVPQYGQILQRGLEAFAELGYEAVSVRQLNVRLGMGHTFIHDRYGTKEEFWKAVVQSAIEQATAEINAAVETAASDDDVDRLIAGVRAFHLATSRRPHLMRVIDYEAGIDSDRLAYLYEQMAPLNDAGRPQFDLLVKQGRIRDIPWYLFHFAVTKPVAMYSQEPLARLFGRPDNADDHTLLSTLVLNGLLTQPTT
jgi:AcrR family transcriptional regulator